VNWMKNCLIHTMISSVSLSLPLLNQTCTLESSIGQSVLDLLEPGTMWRKSCTIVSVCMGKSAELEMNLSPESWTDWLKQSAKRLIGCIAVFKGWIVTDVFKLGSTSSVLKPDWNLIWRRIAQNLSLKLLSLYLSSKRRKMLSLSMRAWRLSAATWSDTCSVCSTAKHNAACCILQSLMCTRWGGSLWSEFISFCTFLSWEWKL